MLTVIKYAGYWLLKKFGGHTIMLSLGWPVAWSRMLSGFWGVLQDIFEVRWALSFLLRGLGWSNIPRRRLGRACRQDVGRALLVQRTILWGEREGQRLLRFRRLPVNKIGGRSTKPVESIRHCRCYHSRPLTLQSVWSLSRPDIGRARPQGWRKRKLEYTVSAPRLYL